jgi:hypothetical protein
MPRTSKRSSTKTNPAKKSEGPKNEAAADLAAASGLSSKDAGLLQAFQSNLLSLLSHELKTPLTGILNALALLSEGSDGEPTGVSPDELLDMAFRNAQRLNHTLTSLLDLAALESGNFRVKLREAQLGRLARGLLSVQTPLLERKGFRVEFETKREAPCLADPQKLGRALVLALEAGVLHADESEPLRFEASGVEISIGFKIKKGREESWDSLWKDAQAGSRTFAGTLQMERQFLASHEEGLGSELLLLHEILRLHRGRVEGARKGSSVEVQIRLPELESMESLKTVLLSRSEHVESGIGSVALALMHVPEGKTIGTFCTEVKSKLFRTTDAVYPLPEVKQVALVMDDCAPHDAARLVERIQKSLGQQPAFGTAVYPQEAGEIELLIRVATERLKAAEKSQ